MTRRLRNIIFHWRRARTNKAKWAIDAEAGDLGDQIQDDDEEASDDEDEAIVEKKPAGAMWEVGWDAALGQGWRNKPGGKKDEREAAFVVGAVANK